MYDLRWSAGSMRGTRELTRLTIPPSPAHRLRRREGVTSRSREHWRFSALRFSTEVRAIAFCLLPICLLAMGAQPAQPNDDSNGLQIVEALERAVENAVARSQASVVAIARVRAQPFEQRQSLPDELDFVPSQFGTGVIVDRRGLILTNNHVLGEIEGSQYFVTSANRRRFRAEVKATDPRSDLAILDIRGAAPSDEFTPIRFGDAKTLKKGSFVIALGNPYAIARDGQASASMGIISNLLRKVAPEANPATNQLNKTMLHHFGWLIQTDARLNLGTSGGALVNLKGEMVGLTTSMAAVSGYEQAAGYAIPVDDTFRRIVEQLKEGREVAHGFLGIQIGPLVQGTLPNRDVTGATVVEVIDGTPAADASLRSGDVITSVDGEAVHDRDHLMLLLGKLPMEAVTQLTVLRPGRDVPIHRKAVLAKFHVRQKKITTAKKPSWRGLQVDYTTATLRPDWAAVGRVIITDVESESPAAREGLEPNMFITHVDGLPIRTPSQFHSALAGLKGPVALTVVPDPHPLTRAEEIVVEAPRR